MLMRMPQFNGLLLTFTKHSFLRIVDCMIMCSCIIYTMGHFLNMLYDDRPLMVTQCDVPRDSL